MPQAEGEHIRFDITITPGISAIVKIESLFRRGAARCRRQRASTYTLTLTITLGISAIVKIESLFRWRAARRRRQRASIYALTLTTALDVSDTVKIIKPASM